MKKYVLKSGEDFLHFESVGIVSWPHPDLEALCAFDTRKEADEARKELGLNDSQIVVEHFQNANP